VKDAIESPTRAGGRDNWDNDVRVQTEELVFS
jgi:hypothetical protein